MLKMWNVVYEHLGYHVLQCGTGIWTVKKYLIIKLMKVLVKADHQNELLPI